MWSKRPSLNKYDLVVGGYVTTQYNGSGLPRVSFYIIELPPVLTMPPVLAMPPVEHERRALHCPIDRDGLQTRVTQDAGGEAYQQEALDAPVTPGKRLSAWIDDTPRRSRREEAQS